MKFRLLPVMAAAFLFAACSTLPDEEAGSGVETVAAGTVEDFQKVVGDRVFFGFDQYTLSAEAKDVLRKQAGWLKKNSAFKLVVEGHADERGTREYNLALGERRANSIKTFLVSQGVPTARVRVVSFGKERPVCTQSVDACWTQNRRGVSVLQQ